MSTPADIDKAELALQWELLDLKIEYLSRPSDSARNAEFAEREAEIGARFSRIGRSPSYPTGFDWSHLGGTDHAAPL
jgi:hypothetical protein